MSNIDHVTEAGGTTPPASIRVWDPVVRLFHWSLVSLFAIAWITAEEWDSVHEYAGYAIIGLIAIRLVWGVVGTRYARFSDFVYRPSVVIAYLKDSVFLRAKRYIGHNPAGGAMVVALLISVSIAVGTGILSITDRFWGVKWIGELHEATSYLALALVFLHVLGVGLASFQHRENLVRSMLTGLKRRDE